MYLQYGVSDSGELVYVGQVARGATGLHCPYCGGLLLAKKGQIKVHHFAHAGETCRQVNRSDDTLALPAYDSFNLHVPPKVLQQLRDFAAGKDSRYYSYETLEAHELIRFNEYNRAALGGDWELTKKGKLIVGQLSLMLFNEFQEPLILERHQYLENQAREAYARPDIQAQIDQIQATIDELELHLPLGGNYWGGKWTPEESDLRTKINELVMKRNRLYEQHSPMTKLDYQTAIIDLRLYRVQWRRILACALYFLAINDGQFYKIGVTTRDIQERIIEIQIDLLPRLGAVKIDVLGTWPGRGNVELYFKYRYQAQQTLLGTLTEYFQFDDVKPVLRDLRRMKPKQMTPLEAGVLHGELSSFEERLRLEEVEQRRRAAVRAGMEKARRRGKQVGRPAESEEAFLAKPEHITAWEALQAGLSLRQAAAKAGLAINTVRKIQKLRQAGS